ncbi:dermonecrotic toxin domain-containing protein [Pseudomonas putida]
MSHSNHAALLQSALPPWIKNTTLTRIEALRAVGLTDPAPYPNATSGQHQRLKAAIARQWQTQNQLDRIFQGLTDVYAFAEPLLKHALAAYGELDVRTTFLRTYTSAEHAWWVVGVKQGEHSRMLSLLDAALHNFAAGDAFTDFAFLGPQDARGQRDIVKTSLTALAFKSICRQLDLGAQYQARLKQAVGYHHAITARDVRLAVLANLKAALTVATHQALLRGDIAQDAHDSLLLLAGGYQHVRLDGQPLNSYALSLLDCPLTGVMLFGSQPGGRMLAWVPEDPQHPLKEYPTPQACAEELSRQLHDADYRQFFSQFIDHERRGAFLAALKARPRLVMHALDIREDHPNRGPLEAENDLWNYLYRVKLNKLLNDARQIAVPTAHVDRLARWAWWDNLEKILSDLLDVALLVATPFVPGLGQVMLAYTAYQLADDVFEGVVDWAQGRGREAVGHLLGVARSLVEAGAFAGAGAVGEVARAGLSPFVEGLRPVQLPDGQTRLWNPDLAPYAHTDVSLPPKAEPLPSGLHQHQQRLILRLDDQHYVLRDTGDSGEHRVLHPRRATAYQPRITGNGQGAWVHEGEQPRTWDSSTLMRRLGPSVQGLSDLQLARIRRISGTDDGVLRRMYVRNQPTPPLLRETLQRFERYEYPRRASETIRDGQALPLDPSSDWFEQMVTELAGWPSDKAIEVFVRSDLSGESHKYGNVDAKPVDTLRLSLTEVMSGRLPERVLGFLDNAQIHQLLGAEVAPEQRAQALRGRLADYVLSQTSSITHFVELRAQRADSPRQQQLRRHVPGLGSHTAQTLLEHTGEPDLQRLDSAHPPLAVLEQARELALAERSTLAFEGLYHSARITPDTEQMLLNALRLHTDSFADVRLEIRDALGTLRSSVGPATASTLRQVLQRPGMGYEVAGSPPGSLYEAILLALPNKPLGYRPGQGGQLREWLIDSLEPLAERRRALAQAPERSIADRHTVTLLGGPALARLTPGSRQTDVGHAREVLQLLFPTLAPEKIERVIAGVRPQQLRTTLNNLTLEKQRLHVELDTWRRSPTRHPKGSAEERRERSRRRRLGEALNLCWTDRFAEHVDGWGHTQRGARLDLSHQPLPETLPPLNASFEHVTHLTLQGTGFSQAHVDLLSHFPTLRSLNLNDNTLAHLPPTLGQLLQLHELGLSNNQLVLSVADVSTLGSLRRLQVLNLSNNPLGLAPNVSLMRELRILDLSRSQIRAWPTGVFLHPKDSGFELNLSATLIDHLPEAPPGSSAAELIARTRLDRRRLSDQDRQRYERYRLAAGLDPNRTYDPRGDASFWLSEAEGPRRLQQQQVWDAVEHEHGSQGFFEVIKSLEAPAFFEAEDDEVRYALNRSNLTAQVWRLLHATHADSQLREDLFKLSSFPGLCADGGAQIFNEMGIEVLASEAQRYSLNDAERQARLVTLAKGTARLKHLGEVIRSDIRQRLNPVDQGGLGQRLRAQMVDGIPGEVDEVDIYLAYQTSLAERLDLPWLADHMLYRETANVSTVQIERAYGSVLALGDGDGLVNQMLLEPYWEHYLRDSHPREDLRNELRFDQRFFALEALQENQAKWAPGLPAQDQQTLRDTARELLETLGKPQTTVGDEPMPDTLYDQLLNELGYQQKEWLRQLTREALVRHDGRRNREPNSDEA